MNIGIILFAEVTTLNDLPRQELGASLLSDLAMFFWVMLGVGVPVLVWKIISSYRYKSTVKKYSDLTNYINVAENSAGIVFWNWDIDRGYFYLQGVIDGKKYTPSVAYSFDFETLELKIIDSDRTRIVAMFKRCQENGGTKIDTICRVRRSTEPPVVRTWRIVGDVEPDLEKAEHRMCGMLQDVSDWMVNEDARRRREEEYRFLVQNANCIILRFNTEGIITYFNEYAQHFFGFSADEIIGRHVMGTIVPEHDSKGKTMRPLLMDIANNPQQYASNLNENIRKDGSRVWVAWTNKAFHSGVKEQEEVANEVLSIGIDVTSRREMEDALRRNERLKEVILENITEGIAYINTDMTIGWVNSVTADMAGIPRRQMIGMKCHEAFQDLGRECINCPVRKAVSSQDTQVYVGRGMRGIWLEITAVPVVEGSRVVGVVETFVDISEKMKHEKQQINQQRLETLGQLAGGLAYDFNNHINGIIGYCGILDKSELGDEQKRMVELIKRSGNRCHQLNRQLLAFENLDHSNFSRVDIAPLVRQSCLVAEEALKDKGGDVECKVEDKELWVEGDSGQLNSMLLSLVFHFQNNLSEKGRLIVRAMQYHVDNPQEVVDEGELPKGEYVLVEFEAPSRDCAANEDILEYRYEKIFRSEVLSARKNLGLTGAYGVARGHQGNIALKRDYMGGVLIQVFLPVKVAGASAVDKLDTDGEKYAGKPLAKTLIIDDDPVNRLLLQEALTRYGIVSDLAGDGLEGCQKYEPGEHELIFLDMVMPKLNGTQTFNRLIECDPQAKIILISGFSVENEISALLLRGALGVLSKPFDISEIESMVEKMFTGRMLQ